MQTLIQKLEAFKKDNTNALSDLDILGSFEDLISDAKWECERQRDEALAEQPQRMSDVEFDYKASIGAVRSI